MYQLRTIPNIFDLLIEKGYHIWISWGFLGHRSVLGFSFDLLDTIATKLVSMVEKILFVP